MRLNGVGAVAFFIALLATAYFIWGDGRPTSETFRYKLTINVTVDGKPYSASSVIEARQKKASCLFRGGGGSGASGGCLPRFYAKGVAPMIMLPDGAVIFASLSGYHGERREFRGTSLSRLPWHIYVDNWHEAADISGKNWGIIPLPKETRRVEVPFEGHPKSQFRPTVRYVDLQSSAMPSFNLIGLKDTLKPINKKIQLLSFVIQPTTEQLLEKIKAPPAWIQSARSMRRFRGVISSIESGSHGNQ